MSENDQTSDEVVSKETVARVLAELLIGLPDDLEQFLAGPVAGCPSDFIEVAETFRENLGGALEVCLLPYLMVGSRVHERVWTSIHSAERIRALVLPESERDAVAYEKASARYKAQFGDKFVNHLTQQLDNGLSDPKFKSTAQELLRQTFVAIWSSFEVFVSDFLRKQVNQKPALSNVIFRDENSRRHFQAKRISVDALAVHGFDVSAAMGDLIFGQRHIDSLPMMRDARGGKWHISSVANLLARSIP